MSAEEAVSRAETLEMQHPLLRLVAAAVARDPGTAGFTGTLAIGVRSSTAERYLVIELGEKKRLGVAELMPYVDAVVCLDEATADGILTRGELPGPFSLGFRIYGDGGLIEKLVRRYLLKKGLVAVRAEALQ